MVLFDSVIFCQFECSFTVPQCKNGQPSNVCLSFTKKNYLFELHEVTFLG